MESPLPSTAVNGGIVFRCLPAVGAVGLLVLAGCSASPPAPAPTAVDAAESEHVHALPSAAPASPTWDAASAGSATQVGLDAMRAFARVDLDPEAWYELLAGYLTAPAQQAFWGTDPSTIPVRVIHGTRSLPGPSPFLAEVTAFTDAGDYQLLLVRDGAGQPFKVERLEPAR